MVVFKLLWCVYMVWYYLNYNTKGNIYKNAILGLTTLGFGLSTKSNGLFGYANAPIIKNIAFTNVSISGYYASLFAHGVSRGKNPDNTFNGYEGMFSNVYISVKSIKPGGSGRVGILANNVLPSACKLYNVIAQQGVKGNRFGNYQSASPPRQR